MCLWKIVLNNKFCWCRLAEFIFYDGQGCACVNCKHKIERKVIK